MNDKELLTEVLKNVLTAETVNDLNLLAKRISSKKQTEEYGCLSQAIEQSNTLRFIFGFAKNNQPVKLDEMGDNYLDNREVMEVFRISKRTLISWRSSGILPYERFRRKCYYRLKDVKQLLEKNYTGEGKISL